MRLLGSTSLLFLGSVDLASAWTTCLPKMAGSRHSRYNRSNTFSRKNGCSVGTATVVATAMAATAGPNNDYLSEFDHLLHENIDAPTESFYTTTNSRRIVKVGSSNTPDDQVVIMTSAASLAQERAKKQQQQQQQQQETSSDDDPSTTTGTARSAVESVEAGGATVAEATNAAPVESPEEAETTTGGDEGEEMGGGDEGGEYDPYAELDYQRQMGKIQQYQETKPPLGDRIKQMDFQDIVITLVIPAIVSFAGLRWGFNKVATRVAEKSDTLLDSFANEMVHHDGNFEEMKLCHADYSRKLMWMGPKKGDAMIKRYLAAYAKKKTVTPKSIGTISYVLSLFKLSQERAAQVMVSLCREMGTDKISSAGKILFYGSRILNSPEGQEGLVPIKEMIKGTYRDAAVAETLVESSQQAIGEAAYRMTVQEGGKRQKTLTPGWEVLGLDKETATRIFEDEAEQGFVSDRETMYGGQSAKYDKKGRLIDEEGKLKNPEEAEEEDDDDDDEGTSSNVYTCGECGYTLFIAKGREFKFYGDDFECPECGAKKDKFKPANIEED